MNYTKWLQQRETFKWLAYLMIFLYGLENQTTKYFLLYYFKDRFHIQTAQAVIYYSVTEAIYSVAQIIGGAVIGRYTDRTRNLRRVVVGVMLLSFGGNFYVLHGQLWLVILGRFLMGFPESLQTAVIGEVRRSYQNEQEKLKRVISWFEVFNQLGINIGAGLPILFTGFRIRIGYLKLDKYNMVNLLIAVIFFCSRVVGKPKDPF
uniref:Major facilitator superfamily (MFS) profile domain-containing protein n=1 Tax=Clytia hemisphaerica TaxID=252671 RepID=A0A7M5UN57_9CNID